MILVTGGTGLVGSHLLLELCNTNDQVRAIRRTGSNIDRVRNLFKIYLEDPDSHFKRIEWVEADITDVFSMSDALRDIRFVYHAAADVSINPGAGAASSTNVEGTANVVNLCLELGIEKLCFVSSTAALGSGSADEEIREDMIWTYHRKRSAYSVSKFNSEMEVWRGMAEGLKAVIVNPSIIIGPGDWSRSSSYLFTAVWKGMRFYTRGVTGYVDIHDVIKCMIALMEGETSGERFTISAENLSYKEILDQIAGALGKKPPGIFASRLLTSVAWRADWLLSKITGRSRSITRDASRSGRRIANFSNRKIVERTGIEFTPIEKSVADTARIFLAQQQA
jgi:nucleoside-diphosphate-sugar epimerase